jgi:hypothetical protein
MVCSVSWTSGERLETLTARGMFQVLYSELLQICINDVGRTEWVDARIQFGTNRIKGTAKTYLYIQLVRMNRVADNDILAVDTFQGSDKSPHNTCLRDFIA